MEEAGSAVEALLKEDPPNAKEAWRRMKGWYKAAAKRGPPPAQATLEQITAERTELYSQVPSPEENIPVTIELTHIMTWYLRRTRLRPPSRSYGVTGWGAHEGSASHPLMCSARILDGPPDLLRRSFLTAASISSSVGTESSMFVGSTVTGIFSPVDGTWPYSSVRSAVIRSSVARAGGGPLFATDL